MLTYALVVGLLTATSRVNEGAAPEVRTQGIVSPSGKVPETEIARLYDPRASLGRQVKQPADQSSLGAEPGCRDRFTVVERELADIPAISCDQPSRLGALIKKGEALAEQGSLVQLRGTAGSMLAEHPGDLEVCVALANLFSSHGDLKFAVEILEYCISMNPRSVVFRYALGDLLEVHGDPTAALAQYSLSLQIDPSDAQGYFKIAEVHLKAGRRALADMFFAHAASLDHDFEALAIEMRSIW